MSSKRLLSYALITLVCGLFSVVYEHFSHGVYSNFMVYLFAIPLLLGVVPELLVLALPILRVDSPWARLVQNLAIATLISGSAIQGVIEIYGTTSGYIVYYFVAGAVLLVTSGVIWAAKYRRHE